MNIPNEYLAKTEDIADQVSVNLCVFINRVAFDLFYVSGKKILLTARKYFGIF